MLSDVNLITDLMLIQFIRNLQNPPAHLNISSGSKTNPIIKGTPVLPMRILRDSAVFIQIYDHYHDSDKRLVALEESRQLEPRTELAAGKSDKVTSAT